MHAKIEYYTETEETAEFKLLRAKIANEQAKANGTQETADFYQDQVKKMQKDILLLQQAI
jgi:hypothetical protein